MDSRIIIIDYDMGNIHSVYKRISRISNNCHVVSTPKDIFDADKIILPGVGHFGKAMENLARKELIEALHEVVLVKKVPILGICLGMQLMASYSEEGDAKGLAWFDAQVERFEIKDKLTHKIPHTGWNQINIKKNSNLLQGVENHSEFYFVHSYHVKAMNEEDVLTQTEYETTFTSAIEKDNMFGAQFHPEKSHDVGERLIKNFIQL